MACVLRHPSCSLLPLVAVCYYQGQGASDTFDPVVIASRLRTLGDLYNQDVEGPAREVIAKMASGKVTQSSDALLAGTSCLSWGLTLRLPHEDGSPTGRQWSWDTWPVLLAPSRSCGGQGQAAGTCSQRAAVQLREQSRCGWRRLTEAPG